MRRKDREVTDFEALIAIVDQCEIVRLGLADGEYPYIVPVNFAYDVADGQLRLYIHGAMAGRKYALLRACPRCSFEMDVPLGLERIDEKRDVTMRYLSVMGRAEAEFLEGAEKERAMDEIIMARSPLSRGYDYNRAALPRTAVIRFNVTELTGKANPFSGNAD